MASVNPASRRRVFLVSENVTLAQVVRLKVLGASLPESEYEVHFAASAFDPMVFAGTRFVQHPLYTVSQAEVFKALKGGKRLYEAKTLARYLDAELALIDRVEPHVIVGDFRLSLSVSAELRRVPWATLINAYWSPFALRDKFPVPDHPIIKLLGEDMTERYFPQAVPHVFKHFAAPVNQLRRRHGLPAIGSLLEVLTHADYTLYPDDPELYALAGAPASHRFLGPVLWAPDVPPPPIPEPLERPLVYVTLGSSGELDTLPRVVEALAALPVFAVVATAGRATLGDLPPNVVSAPFVSGDQLAARAALVVSNGGSTTGYQALAAGTPLLGLPSNLDQYLSMQALERAGVARLIKARSATAQQLRSAIEELLGSESHKAAARRTAARFATHDAVARFREWLAEVLA